MAIITAPLLSWLWLIFLSPLKVLRLMWQGWKMLGETVKPLPPVAKSGQSAMTSIYMSCVYGDAAQ